MKKATVILMIMFIFLFTGGFSFVVSFCPMSEEWSLAFFSNKACSCEDEDEDCCQQTHVQLKKIEDNFVPSVYTKVPADKSFFLYTVLVPGFLTEKFHNVFFCHFFISESPPDPVPIFLSNRVLII